LRERRKGLKKNERGETLAETLSTSAISLWHETRPLNELRPELRLDLGLDRTSTSQITPLDDFFDLFLAACRGKRLFRRRLTNASLHLITITGAHVQDAASAACGEWAVDS